MMEFEELSQNIIKTAIQKGADQAEVYIESERETQVGTRLSKVESIKESISRGIGIRVFKDKKMGFAFSSDLEPSGLKQLAATAVELARYASEDDYNGLPEPEKSESINLDLYDPHLENVDISWKIDACKRMEDKFFAYDKRIVNSEGAYYFDGDATVYIANSLGLSKSYRGSHFYLYAVPIAREDGKLQTGYWYSSKRHFAELESPEKVAETAAARVVRMLGASVPKTAKVPVIFDPLTASALIGNILAAIDGDAVYKNSTFLVDKLGHQIASEIVNIRDDALMPRGLGSAPFDGEGLPASDKAIIENGKLVSYLYDTYTARKAKARSTASAHRGYSSTPEIGGYNFYLLAGKNTPGEIVGSVKDGFYVTNLMGFGSDIVTGDFSQGASGLWIENGKLTKPVEGLTIASNMPDILHKIEMIGNDLTFMGGVSSPTIKISQMAVAGA